MSNRQIISPMARGSGAYVVHQLLENHLKGYLLIGYNPYWEMFPFALNVLAPNKNTDLVHTTPDYAVFFYQKSTPLILTFHNYILDGWMRKYSSWVQCFHYAVGLRILNRLAFQKAHTVTAVSRFTAQLVQHDLNISQPVKVIYNGVDINLFTPASSSTSGHKEVRVFFSGNLTRRKGAHWLPYIAKYLKQKVCIYYTQGLRTRRDLPKDSVLKPVGPILFEEMPKRYRQMDILVMPTVREGLSISVLEAMASGLPVVASHCSSLPELIDDGKGGFLCPVGDVKSFAEKINLLADSPNLRREMGEYNRVKVEKYFTVDRMVKEYHELFEKVLG